MRSRTRNWVYTGLVLALLAGQTGCKSGWKMPGADMFSWGRKPSESTLVGSGPSVSTPNSSTASTATAGSAAGSTMRANNAPAGATNSPVSPALRSNPNQVASTAVNPGAASRPGATNFGGYGPNGSTPYGSAANASPVPGAAASANGYTTGSYATSQPRAPMGVNNAPYGQVASAPAPGMQPSSTQLPGQQLPGQQLPGQQLPSAQGMPFAQGVASLPTAAPNYNYPSTSPVAGSPQGVYGGMTVPRGASNVAAAPSGSLPPAAVPNGLPVARAGAAQGLPALPVSSGSNLPPGLPSNTQMPVAYGGAAPSAMPVMSTPAASGSGSAAYLPGSVGRSNPYNFSNQGPGATPSAPAPSYPRTAADPYANPSR